MLAYLEAGRPECVASRPWLLLGTSFQVPAPPPSAPHVPSSAACQGVRNHPDPLPGSLWMLPAKGMGKAFPELPSPLVSLQYLPPGFPGMDHQQLPTGFRSVGSLSPGPSLGAREALSLTTLLSQNSDIYSQSHRLLPVSSPRTQDPEAQGTDPDRFVHTVSMAPSMGLN